MLIPAWTKRLFHALFGYGTSKQALVSNGAGTDATWQTLTPADVGADASGTAAASMSAHLAASDPHPQYLTAAEGNAAYDAIGAAAAAQAASQPLNTTLTAVAALTFAANTFPARASAGSLAAKTITDFGLSLVDDADATAARTTLGLGTLATQSGTFSGTSSGTNTGDQDLSSYATTAAVAAGYQPLDGDLTSLAAAAGTNTIYYRSAANTWSAVTVGTGLSFTGGSLTCTVTAPVSSVFGRTGAVVAASGDYTVSQVTGAAPLASPTFTGTVGVSPGTAGDGLLVRVSGGSGAAIRLEGYSDGGVVRGYNGGSEVFHVDTTTNGAFYYTNGLAGFGESGPGAQLHVTSRAAARKGVIVQGATSQTADLQQWQDSTGAVLAAVTKNGAFTPASLADSAAANGTLYYSTTAGKLVYKDSGGAVNALY